MGENIGETPTMRECPIIEARKCPDACLGMQAGDGFVKDNAGVTAVGEIKWCARDFIPEGVVLYRISQERPR